MKLVIVKKDYTNKGDYRFVNVLDDMQNSRKFVFNLLVEALGELNDFNEKDKEEIKGDFKSTVEGLFENGDSMVNVMVDGFEARDEDVKFFVKVIDLVDGYHGGEIAEDGMTEIGIFN